MLMQLMAGEHEAGKYVQLFSTVLGALGVSAEETVKQKTIDAAAVNDESLEKNCGQGPEGPVPFCL